MIEFNNVASLTVCISPNVRADITINSLSFLINLLMQPLKIHSSTIGAYITASGINMTIGNFSSVC